MAIYHLSTKPIARSSGRSAVAAAAYRAGVELVDTRTGQIHDYTRKAGVAYTEILTPDGLSSERGQLWNLAEAAEKRKDARTAREWIAALPAELSLKEQIALAHGFAHSLMSRYGVAVDFAIHEPDDEGDARNFHVHILTTTRKVGRDESGSLVFGDKAEIELSDKKLRERGIKAGAAAEIEAVRELWEQEANLALERAGRSERIDRRSLREQGVDREPTTHLGVAASGMERKGIRTDRGDINRSVKANGAERAAARAEIVSLERERARRAKRAAAKAELDASHGWQPDRMATAQVVLAAVLDLGQAHRREVARRWDARLERRRVEQERQERRGRLLDLVAALEADAECRLRLREAYEAAGYRLEQRPDGSRAFVYPHGDLLEERQAVRAARRARDERRRVVERDRVTEQEQGPGVRHPDKPRWRVERERVLEEVYGTAVAEKLGQWYRIERRADALVLRNDVAEVMDFGDRVVAQEGNDKEIAALVLLAKAKGWERVTLTGSVEFQDRAAIAFLQAGIPLEDHALEERAKAAIARQEQERVAAAAKEKGNPVLTTQAPPRPAPAPQPPKSVPQQQPQIPAPISQVPRPAAPRSPAIPKVEPAPAPQRSAAEPQPPLAPAALYKGAIYARDRSVVLGGVRIFDGMVSVYKNPKKYPPQPLNPITLKDGRAAWRSDFALDDGKKAIIIAYLEDGKMVVDSRILENGKVIAGGSAYLSKASREQELDLGRGR